MFKNNSARHRAGQDCVGGSPQTTTRPGGGSPTSGDGVTVGGRVGLSGDAGSVEAGGGIAGRGVAGGGTAGVGVAGGGTAGGIETGGGTAGEVVVAGGPGGATGTTGAVGRVVMGEGGRGATAGGATDGAAIDGAAIDGAATDGGGAAGKGVGFFVGSTTSTERARASTPRPFSEMDWPEAQVSICSGLAPRLRATRTSSAVRTPSAA